MSSKKAQLAQKRNERRGQRSTSNIFSAFSQQEIQEFKEAFNLIDQVLLYAGVEISLFSFFLTVTEPRWVYRSRRSDRYDDFFGCSEY